MPRRRSLRKIHQETQETIRAWNRARSVERRRRLASDIVEGAGALLAVLPTPAGDLFSAKGKAERRMRADALHWSVLYDADHDLQWKLATLDEALTLLWQAFASPGQVYETRARLLIEADRVDEAFHVVRFATDKAKTYSWFETTPYLRRIRRSEDFGAWKPREQIEVLAADYLRPTWIPRFGPDEGGMDGSRIGGLPWLRRGEAWPICDACNQPMHFFLQIDAASLPSTAQAFLGDGMVQMFYCVNRDQDCFLEQETALVRIVHPLRERAQDTIEVPALPRAPFAGLAIEGWEERSDLPDVREMQDVPLNDYQKELAREGYEIPWCGEKLGGWPQWLQDVSYPKCGKCQAPMRFVFQLDYSENVPYMFGDSGCGHIFQCRKHREVLVFRWDGL